MRSRPSQPGGHDVLRSRALALLLLTVLMGMTHYGRLMAQVRRSEHWLQVAELIARVWGFAFELDS